MTKPGFRDVHLADITPVITARCGPWKEPRRIGRKTSHCCWTCRRARREEAGNDGELTMKRHSTVPDAENMKAHAESFREAHRGKGKWA